MARNQAVAQPKHAHLQGQQQARVEDLAAPMEEADELDEAANSVVDLGLGNVEQTLAEAESSLLVHLELYEWLGSKEGMAAAYRNLGILYQTLGDLAPAEAMYKEALKLDEALDRKEGMAAADGYLGREYQPRKIDLNRMTRRKHKEHKPAGIPHRALGTTPPTVLLSGTPMPAASPDVIELTERNFGSSIDGHPFAVIDIWAPSSAPCRAFAPTFAAAAARNPDVLFAKVNAEDQQAMVEQFDIRSFPTLIIFRSNIIVYAKPGAPEARALDEVLAAARALDMEEVRRKVVSVDTVAVGAATAPTTDVRTQPAADARLLSATLEPQKDRTRSAAMQMTADTLGVVELTDQSFVPYVNGHPFAVVDFWAPSSSPSRAFAPTFAAAAGRNPDVLFVKVNAEVQRATVAQFNLRSVPALLIIRRNIVVYSKAGVLEAGALDEALAAARALDMEQVRRKAGGDAVASGALSAPGNDVEARAAADASHLSIETYLRPALRGPGSALKDVVPRLAAGGLVVIRDAFEADFAERMYRSLDSYTTWRVHENYAERFSYYHHNVYHPEEFPADLAWCSKVFNSSKSKAWATRLSGRTCLGPTSISASWYLPGDHSLPHSDNVTTGAHFIRQLAFVWHLAKDWRSEWGGAFYWCPKASYMPPAFNTLYLFNVGPESTHFVTEVSPYAQGKRLTINGWWTGPAATGDPVWKGPERIGTGDTEILIY
jgi:thioredoxin 1